MTSHLLLALAPTPGGSGGGGAQILIFQIVAIGLVFYFLILRPQSQGRKRHQEMLANLKKGDDVMTAGGIVGKVRDIKDVTDPTETRVTIETGTSTVVVERSRIVRVGTKTAPSGAAQG